MAKVETILEDIKGLTLLEASDLVKKLEEAFGVSAAAAAPVAVAGGAAAAGAAPAEEKTEFAVVLTEVGANKINVIKAVREVTSLGLKEAKDLVDGAPKTVKEGINKDEAATIKKKFEDAGAKVDIQVVFANLAEPGCSSDRRHARFFFRFAPRTVSFPDRQALHCLLAAPAQPEKGLR